MSRAPTGSQTVGPFFKLGLSWLYTREIGAAALSGRHVELRGHVYDGLGRPIPDALLEFWQADANGLYHTEAGAEFMGFARVPTDADGVFELRTVKPGRVGGRSGQLQAPHLNVYVFMRGLLLPLLTRMYFPDEPVNAEDPVLALVPEARRETLIARSSAAGVLEWDIHTQGDREIVCFVA
ncbi:MAG TPA: protocatechuate 3,4-dioxygenase subunit alpha [Polyangiales bacterium]|nr:protocatechuate 3,4-dioxygenase subunit alpha [Polyangiales bacterium]